MTVEEMRERCAAVCDDMANRVDTHRASSSEENKLGFLVQAQMARGLAMLIRSITTE